MCPAFPIVFCITYFFFLCLNCYLALYPLSQLSAELTTLGPGWQPCLWSFLVLNALLMVGMFLLVGSLFLFGRYSLSLIFRYFSNFAAIQCFLFPSLAPCGP